jgi:adenosylhomocysteine nucleosidase
LSPSKTIAIVAALEREVSSLVRHWGIHEQKYAGRVFRFYENENAVLVCGGIGSEPARRCAEAIIALYHPTLIYSAGFAGAADPNTKVGDIVVPRYVIDALDGSRIDTGIGEGILVSFAAVADSLQKAKFHAAFNAKAVDMEAAAVAKAAAVREIRFAAVKAISDSSGFQLPPLDRFINPAGGFDTAKFAFFVMLRPWMWLQIARLQKNSALASNALCARLAAITAEGDVIFPSESKSSQPGARTETRSTSI